MARLSPETERTFYDWIDVPYWYDRSDAEERRFDRFVETLIVSGDKLTPKELRDLIIETRRDTLSEALLDVGAERYMERYREKVAHRKELKLDTPKK